MIDRFKTPVDMGGYGITNLGGTFGPNVALNGEMGDARYRRIGVAVPWADLSDVPATFAPSAHTHPLSALTQSGATIDQVPRWNGTAWVPATVSGGGGGGNSGQSFGFGLILGRR